MALFSDVDPTPSIESRSGYLEDEELELFPDLQESLNYTLLSKVEGHMDCQVLIVEFCKFVQVSKGEVVGVLSGRYEGKFKFDKKLQGGIVVEKLHDGVLRVRVDSMVRSHEWFGVARALFTKLKPSRVIILTEMEKYQLQKDDADYVYLLQTSHKQQSDEIKAHSVLSNIKLLPNPAHLKDGSAAILTQCQILRIPCWCLVAVVESHDNATLESYRNTVQQLFSKLGFKASLEVSKVQKEHFGLYL